MTVQVIIQPIPTTVSFRSLSTDSGNAPTNIILETKINADFDLHGTETFVLT